MTRTRSRSHAAPLLTSAALTAGATVAGGLALAGWGVFVERQRFQLREATLPILPPDAPSLRVLHLSDIHMVPGQKLKTSWLRSLARLEPDLVVNTGDNLGHRDALEPLLEALEPVMRFPGVFVPGSNDYFAPVLKNPFTYFSGPSGRPPKPPTSLPTGALHTAFGNAGWISLANRHQSLAIKGTRFDFSGVDDPHLGRDRYTGFPLGAVNQDASAHVRIGVAHAPYRRVLDAFTRDDARLILAGHTHGGQVCVPGVGALVTNSDLPTSMARGVHRWRVAGRESWLEVSAGIGTSFYAPVRFACPPEAVLLTLTPSGR
ncbi:metallophosphoesterase [Tersicoccus solisilvae]|uniref:Metallophosphoesterase n=1 Tax=Tersicoccus solisilvae TaxID=1882339 RepID=A0ABQ1NMK2_9MICC|nr:metallophosphoesterase [Tersicoccus solisilvae]GGC80870.1 metallophosphoesterase [Tersicoccus solisilvae]